jgi:hypothetical protein
MANNKPDKLAQDVSKAIAAGMSYGKWKALQPIATTVGKPPDGWKRCEYCRKPFKPVQGKRFCDAVCQRQSYKERQRQGVK